MNIDYTNKKGGKESQQQTTNEIPYGKHTVAMVAHSLQTY
jgi:hypothetical protein